MMTLNTIMQIGTMYGLTELDLWKDIQLDTRLDKEVLLFTIIRDCAKSFVIFDTYGSFKQMSDAFFRKWATQITKLTDTYYFDYNPIWNKDGKIVEDHDREIGEKEDTDDNLHKTGGDTLDSTDTHNVSPYNNNSYMPESQDVFHQSTNRDSDDNRTIGRKRDESLGERTVRVEQGNIGVTTTQQMITEERQIQEFNIYNWISEKYQKELFYRVW